MLPDHRFLQFLCKRRSLFSSYLTPSRTPAAAYKRVYRNCAPFCGARIPINPFPPRAGVHQGGRAVVVRESDKSISAFEEIL